MTGAKKSIPDAAIQCQTPYHKIRRFLELGVLKGGRGPDGRWYVTEASLRRYQQQRAVGATFCEARWVTTSNAERHSMLENT